jgi:hypothetical protein
MGYYQLAARSVFVDGLANRETRVGNGGPTSV